MFTQIIDRVQNSFGDFLNFRKIRYSLNEAKSTSWCIRDGLNSIINPIKDYFQFRIIFHERIKYNEPLKNFLAAKNININDFKFEDSTQNLVYIHKKLTKGKEMPYWEKYIISLKWEVLKKLHGKDFQLTPENFESSLKEVDHLFEKLPDNVIKTLDSISNFVYGIGLKETDQIFEFGDTVARIAKNQQGLMGVAHPGMIVKWHYKKTPPSLDTRKEFIRKLFAEFKHNGGDKAVFYEGNYPYFNGGQYLDVDDSFLSFINDEGTNHDLLETGSLDNHGNNLFFTEKLNKYLFKDIV